MQRWVVRDQLLGEREGQDLWPGEAASNTVIRFRPDTGQDKLIARLWSRWEDKTADDNLDSIASITDEPAPEFAAAGQDRCIIPTAGANTDSQHLQTPRHGFAVHRP